MGDYDWSDKWIKKNRETIFHKLSDDEKDEIIHTKTAALAALNGDIEPLIYELKFGISDLNLRLRYTLVALLEGNYHNTNYTLELKQKPKNQSTFEDINNTHRETWDVVIETYRNAELDESGNVRRGYLDKALNDAHDSLYAQEVEIDERQKEIKIARMKRLWESEAGKTARIWAPIITKQNIE